MVGEEQLQPGKTDVSGLSIKDLFFKYLRFLPLFILCVALSLFVAWIYLRYSTLIYQSTGTIVIKDDKTAGGANDDKLAQLMVSDGKKNIQNEIEFIQSRPLLERVVESLDLNFTYMAQGKVKQMNAYKMTPFRVEALQISDSSASFTLDIKFEAENTFHVDGKLFTFGQVFKNANGVFRLVKTGDAVPGALYHVTWQPASAAAANLLTSFAVAPKQGTGILVITAESPNPQLTADVINQLMKEYQAATIEDKNEATEKTLRFIDGRIRVVQHELDSINAEYTAFKKRNNIIDPGTQSSNYLSRIEEAQKTVSVQQLQLYNLGQIDQYLRSRDLAYTLVPTTLGIEDPTLNTLVSGYNKAQLERKALLENAPPGNVAVQQKEEEIEVLRQKVLENLKNIKPAYQAAINRSLAMGGSAESQVRTMPEKEQALLDIQRAQQTKLVVYNSLLQKREESAIALASNISNTKVLQEALPNLTPVKPNRRSAQILAILVGLALPGLFIFVLELLNDKVTTRNDIERITAAAIMGEVGHSYGKENLVVTQNNRKVVAEQFRILRSNLQYVITHVKKPVVLVTSSFSGEGKSFISTNMGAVMALAGKKTIILEFDIRKPKVLSHLNLPKQPGLTNYLLGHMTVEELPVLVPGFTNLYVLPCGPIPPNPAELLLDPQLDTLFEYLKANFDMVIVDTAPVGMVSDAMTLSKYANATLYIVRQGHTYKKQVAMIDDLFRQNKLPKISLVLNDVKLKSGYGYYGYGQYGYGYGYGSDYFEADDTRPPTLMGRWFGWLDGKGGKKSKKKRKPTAV